MNNEKLKMSTPPPSVVACKRFCRFLCALFCTFFAFALVGCGDAYTDEDDYANFVRWQARYETEKELVGLLRDYDAAYKAYMDGAGGSSDIVFSLRGVTVLTDANVSGAWVVYNGSEYCAYIELNNSGAKILADITATNFGEQLEIVEVNGDHRNVILAPTINGTVGNGKITLSFPSEADAKELCGKFSAGAVKSAAIAYNAKRASISARTVNGGYLPVQLPESPEYLDVSAYLQKAETMGF